MRRVKNSKDAQSPMPVRDAGAVSVLAALPLSVADGVEEVFDGPIGPFGRQQIGGRAVLPDAVTKRGGGVGLQLGLGQQNAQVSGQDVAAAALGQERVAAAVKEQVALAAAHQCLVTFQSHPAVPN